MLLNVTDKQKEDKIPPVLRLGFRPFFLFGALYSCLVIIIWSGLYTHPGMVSLTVPSLWWHAHEMLFGFSMAIVGGFLMTAVQNWTGVPGTRGLKLFAIFSLWLLARLSFWVDVPIWSSLVLDTLFMACVAWSLGYRVVVTKRQRNYLFIPILAVAALLNALSYGVMLGEVSLPINQVWHSTLLWFMLLISVMGGRVIPFFTEKKLGIQVSSPPVWLERAIIALFVLLIGVTLVSGTDNMVARGLLLTAGIAQCVRLYRWQGWRAYQVPMLFSLHVFYLFLPLGLLLKALVINPWASNLIWHLFAIGALGGVVLAMIVRVTLGHTGRNVYQGPTVSWLFYALLISALVRVFGMWFWPVYTLELVSASALLWAISYGWFAVRFGPMLSQARADGAAG
ncbi:MULTISPECIES: NnrS family protein [unclassified Salinivibrio]|uniref:NnrS family protein n=1 Tax=unclassified Salinivibrio TaxID=2636825 RepID=UPI001562818A|nr:MULTISPECIES: NnrS family protein [unclassified Salinivibrio]